MATVPTKTLQQLRQEAKRRQTQRGQTPEDQNTLPPEVGRIENAIDVRYVAGPPRAGSYREAPIASVGEHEPHTVEINDLKKFKQGVLQTRGHEIVHLWRSNLPGPVQAKALPDNPKDPYNISNIDQLRAKGYDLSTIPQEVAATIIQTYIADPSQRKRLQPWVDDMNRIPLSVMNATSPDQKGINTTVRPPVPPIEAWESLLGLKQQAAKRKPTPQR
jgi:hypothetical protein